MLILYSNSRERIGVWSGVCAGHWVGAVKTMSQNPGRQPRCIGSSSMQYDPLVHLPSTYFMLHGFLIPS